MEKALNVDIRQFYREDLGVHSEELLDKLEAISQAVTLPALSMFPPPVPPLACHWTKR